MAFEEFTEIMNELKNLGLEIVLSGEDHDLPDEEHIEFEPKSDIHLDVENYSVSIENPNEMIRELKATLPISAIYLKFKGIEYEHFLMLKRYDTERSGTVKYWHVDLHTDTPPNVVEKFESLFKRAIPVLRKFGYKEWEEAFLQKLTTNKLKDYL